MKLILIVIVVLLVLCFFSLRKNCHSSEECMNSEKGIIPEQSTIHEDISFIKDKIVDEKPKKLRYCLKCYTPTRPKDIICRECGEILEPDEVELECASNKKIRYCMNCYTPCKPNAVVCSECGFILRVKYYINAKNSQKKIRYCVKCYTPCKAGEMVCQNCNHEFYT